MTPAGFPPLIAVDIGNSRIKFGRFTGEREESGLPFPSRVLELSSGSFDPKTLESWLAEDKADNRSTAAWWIASVNRAPTEQLTAWLQDRGHKEFHASKKRDEPGAYSLLAHNDLP